MNNIEGLLRDEIQTELKSLDALEWGSKEHQTAIEGITKLADRLIDIGKHNADQENLVKKQEDAKAQAEREHELKEREHELKERECELKEREHELKEQQLKETAAQAKLDYDLKVKQIEEEKKDRLVKNCLTAAGIVIPVWVTIWGTLKTLEFEKTGTVTTIMGRGFINKLLPKK